MSDAEAKPLDSDNAFVKDCADRFGAILARIPKGYIHHEDCMTRVGKIVREAVDRGEIEAHRLAVAAVACEGHLKMQNTDAQRFSEFYSRAAWKAAGNLVDLLAVVDGVDDETKLNDAVCAFYSGIAALEVCLEQERTLKDEVIGPHALFQFMQQHVIKQGYARLDQHLAQLQERIGAALAKAGKA